MRPACDIVQRNMRTLVHSLYHRIPDHIRLGPAYRMQKALILRSRAWSKREILDWQMGKLQEVLRLAYAQTSYYKTLFDKIGFRPHLLSSPADLRRIPILTRDDVRESRDRIRSNNYPRPALEVATTGGTTGTPLEVYYEKRMTSAVESAFVHDIWGRFGHRPNCRTVWARVSDLTDKLYEVRGLKLVVACGHLQKSTFKEIASAIRTFDPAYLFGYPSSLYLLGQLMQEARMPRFDSLRLIMCSSEDLQDYQREFLRSYYGVPVCNLYGNSERTVIAANCPCSDLMHFYPQYGFVEILDSRGQECTEEGAIGEIISTAFTSPAFPLIRYRTGDFAVFTKQDCGCGWNYKVAKQVHGREPEYIVAASGERRPFIATVNMHSNIFANITQFQLVQPSPGIVQVHVIPKDGFSAADGVAVTGELQRVLGDSVTVTTQVVKRMILTKRGKFRFIIHDRRD